MDLDSLKALVLSIVDNPRNFWGEPTSEHEEQSRVQVEQGDVNTARLSSGTYTQEDLDSFNRQESEIEAKGITGSAPFFGGSPDHLPESIPERLCSKCGKTFRSVRTEEKVDCFNCVLDRLCPELPWIWHTATFKREGWDLQLFEQRGRRQHLRFGNSPHCYPQENGICAYFSEGKLFRVSIAAAKKDTRMMHEISWDLEDSSVKLRTGTAWDYWQAGYWHDKRSEVDSESIELVISSLPDFLVGALV